MKTVKMVGFYLVVLLSNKIICAPIKMQSEQKPAMRNAFFAAAKKGDKNQIKVLVAEGADVDWTDHHGRTALHWAALLGHEKVAKHLLKRKANPNARDNKGWTPLHWAAYECDGDMAELLVRYGAKSGKSDNEGNKPHYIASQSKCRLELQTYLLAHRAEDGALGMLASTWNWLTGKGSD